MALIYLCRLPQACTSLCFLNWFVKPSIPRSTGALGSPDEFYEFLLPYSTCSLVFLLLVGSLLVAFRRDVLRVSRPSIFHLSGKLKRVGKEFDSTGNIWLLFDQSGLAGSLSLIRKCGICCILTTWTFCLLLHFPISRVQSSLVLGNSRPQIEGVNTSGVLVDFQVYKPVIFGPRRGRCNQILLLLMKHQFAFSYGEPFIGR